MATKNILLAIADNQIVADINQALGDEWLTTPVANEADALALLDAGSFDALVVDFNLGEADGSELLNQAAEKCPDITRFLLAYEADLALVAAKVVDAHEILPKPIEAASLRSRIESGLSDASPAPAESKAPAADAPAVPAVYAKILKALESPEVTCEQVGNLIASDDSLIQETLTLTRSAYLGLPQKVIEPVDAVEVLGLETVKTLVMALRFLAEHSQSKPCYLSLEKIWEHSVSVAQIARDLVLFETKDRALAAQALAAGLVHDLGKVVLATNYDDLYARVHSLARKQPVPLWEIEKEMFGANHGEIGACLLGMWNLPSAVVDAAALHHEPPLGEHDHLTPLAAVHIANVLEHQLHPSDEFRVMPVVSTPFLNELGLLQRLPIWRATFANQRSRAKVEEAEPVAVVQVAAVRTDVAVSRSANSMVVTPAAETQTATAPSPFHPSLRHWIYTGVAAVVVCMLALLFQLESGSEDGVTVHARELGTLPAPITPTLQAVPSVSTVAEPVVASAAPVAQIAAPVVPAPSIAPAAPSPVVEVAAEPVVVATVASVPQQAVVAETVVTNSTSPNVPVIVSALPFRLNGVIYGVSNPSATVNGKTVFVGEKVNGATVLSIGRSSVVLNINGEQKTISLPAVR